MYYLLHRYCFKVWQCYYFLHLYYFYSVQCAVCSVQCAVSGVQCQLCSVQCAVCTRHCALCTVHCAVCIFQYAVQCAVCIVQCEVGSVQCAVCSVQCAVRSFHCVVCSVQCWPLIQLCPIVRLPVAGGRRENVNRKNWWNNLNPRQLICGHHSCDYHRCLTINHCPAIPQPVTKVWVGILFLSVSGCHWLSIYGSVCDLHLQSLKPDIYVFESVFFCIVQ